MLNLQNVQFQDFSKKKDHFGGNIHGNGNINGNIIGNGNINGNIHHGNSNSNMFSKKFILSRVKPGYYYQPVGSQKAGEVVQVKLKSIDNNRADKGVSIIR